MMLFYLAQFLILNLALNQKKNQKSVLLKTWKKHRKPRKNFEKTSGNPE